jgi:hypothetical protein
MVSSSPEICKYDRCQKYICYSKFCIQVLCDLTCNKHRMQYIAGKMQA